MDQLANATDQSSYVVKVDFTDESGDAVTPTAATWTLTDGNEDLVNSREDVTISSLAATISIPLSGADLDVDEDGGRTENLSCLVISASYNSSLTGTLLPIRKAVKFLVTDLPQV